MNFKAPRLLLWMAAFFLLSCGQRQRDQQNTQLEQKLNEQRQELILKANQLALQEASLNARAKHLDSIQITSDTLTTALPKLAGTWNVNMICSQATCSGSAVGDTKNEQWEISFHGNTIMAEAYSKKVLSRVYVGDYSDGIIQLTAQMPDSTVDNNFQINVFFRPIGDSLVMNGKRSIIRADCQIIYNLTMKKQ